MSSTTRVIIVGCGVAGPVLALFLKNKGYQPVIYERTPRDTDGGLSLMLQPNGLRVLGLIPGLVSQLPGKTIGNMAMYSMVPGDEGLLGETGNLLELNIPEYSQGIGIGVRRREFLQLLSELALKEGIEIHWQRKVVDVQQQDDSNSVKVIFENGDTDTASFVVGCDGLHSNTRISIFGKEEASFTGLTQMGGFSPVPDQWSKTPSIINFYGEDSHMIGYQVSENLCSWAITRREAETKETWRAVDDSMLEHLRKDPRSEWKFGAGDLVRNAEKIIKYGLYDRPELKTWYKGRVVLLGDAAHPTSPHIGQGANQACEDIYHLTRVLIKYNPSAQPPSTEVLKTAFSEYESIRLPRTSALVKQARQAGESRVVASREACLKRNQGIRNAFSDQAQLENTFAAMRSGPFEGQSEI